jgi:hypothetical protein
MITTTLIQQFIYTQTQQQNGRLQNQLSNTAQPMFLPKQH